MNCSSFVSMLVGEMQRGADGVESVVVEGGESLVVASHTKVHTWEL